MVHEFTRFQYPNWLAYLAGTVECVAVILLLSGFWSPVFYVAGALLLAGVMTGATYINIVKRPVPFGFGTMVLLLLCLVPVAYYRSYLPAIFSASP